jgi:hypothetical protein
VNRLDLSEPRDVRSILDTAFALLGRHGRLLVPLALAVALPVHLIVAAIGPAGLTDGYDATPPLGSTVLQGVVSLLVIAPLVTTMVLHAMLEAAEGREATARRAAAAALEAFPVLVATLVLAYAGVALGMLALVLPGIYLAVIWAVATQAVVVDGERGAGALRRSTELVSGHWLWVFGVFLVANVVTAVLALLLSLPLDVVADAVDSQAVAILGGVIAQAVTIPLMGLLTSLLYFSLRARHEAPPAQGGPPESRLPDRPSEQLDAPAPEGERLWPTPAPSPARGGFEPPRPGAG